VRKVSEWRCDKKDCVHYWKQTWHCSQCGYNPEYLLKNNICECAARLTDKYYKKEGDEIGE
jgi:hypothetical protein